MIEATKLVPGDIIRLEAGDFVPADIRELLKYATLCCDGSVSFHGTSVLHPTVEFRSQHRPLQD